MKKGLSDVKIGYRTIKTAIATPIALFIASLLNVTSVVSAGILTILCIQPSRKKSVESAWERFLACLLSVLFAILFFELFGYHPFVIALLLLAYIPTTVFFQIEKGILTGTVITLNLYAFGEIKLSFLYEQLLLIVIGIGTGLLVNLYMPSLDKTLQRKQRQLEEKMQIILKEIALYIRGERMDWDGKEITEIEQILKETENIVERDRENHLFRETHSYFDYFNMRKKQMEHVERMVYLAARLPFKDKISKKIADFFDKLSEAVHPGNTAALFLDELFALRVQFKSEALPETQSEFETRANLFQLLFEIEQYLLIKNKFKRSDIKEKKKRKLDPRERAL